MIESYAIDIPVLLLMIGAGILSAIIAWRLRGDRISQLKQALDKLRLTNSDLQIESKKLQKSSDELTKQALAYKLQLSDVEEKEKVLSQELRAVKEHKEELLTEFNTFKASVRNSEKQIHQLYDESMVLKAQLKSAEEKVSNWKEKYQTIRSVQLSEESAQASKASIPQAAMTKSSHGQAQNETTNQELVRKYEELVKIKQKLEAEVQVFQAYKSKYDHCLLSMDKKEEELQQLKLNFKEMKEQYERQLAEQESISLEYKSLLEGSGQYETELNQTKENYGQLLKDYEKQISSLEIVTEEQKKLEKRFSKKQQELNLVKKENQELSMQLSALNDIVKQRASKTKSTERHRESILKRIKSRKDKLDWSSIGKVAKDQGDNLKKLRGLGSFVEQKMNAIGIYSLKQLAKLSPEEEDLLNELLELPKHKFQKQEWVLQSRILLGLVNKDQPATILSRIQLKRAQVNYDRIGAAAAVNKDNLQLIQHISPFEEAKLNALGIYKFSQFINMEVDDLAFVNGAIEIEDGRIVNENWVAQAIKLYNANKKASLNRIQERADQLDFERIGKSRRGLKDNLLRINGIGKFTEEKLNALGIFNFFQIANFNKDDVIEINNILELPSGHIKNDDWVAQAKKLMTDS